MPHRAWLALLLAVLTLAGCTAPAPEGSPTSDNSSQSGVPPLTPTMATPTESPPTTEPATPTNPTPPTPGPGGDGLPVCPPPPEPLPPGGCQPPSHGEPAPGGAPAGGEPGPANPGGPSNAFSFQHVESAYAAAPGGTSGAFRTGQAADMMLSGFGFDDAGGPLLFNHPMGLATDGERLALADTRNNRVLVWNALPTADNTPPDIVLGQPDFTTNAPGSDLAGLNWPVAVATDGTRLLVADTYNDRVLVWTSFPTTSGAPADYALEGGAGDGSWKMEWPWAVWTDGQRVAVASTRASQVLVWSSFPAAGAAPDVVLANEAFGTPRSLGTDGSVLMVGDHNVAGADMGNFFWRAFPTQDDQPHDFLMENVPGQMRGDVFYGGAFAPDGRYAVIANSGLHVWDAFPTAADEAPALTLGDMGQQGGDGSMMAYAGGKLWISLYNGNKIVAYDGMPDTASEKPVLVLGAPNATANTLELNHIITNPVPASDGTSLFVSSDYDRKVYAWRERPDDSGAAPDLVATTPEAMWDNALHGGTWVLAGRQTVYVWNTTDLLAGKPPHTALQNIGGVSFRDLRGVAYDGEHLFLADRDADRIYVWNGIPAQDTPPAHTLEVSRPTRLSSDGTYLALAATETNEGSRVKLLPLARLGEANAWIEVKGAADWGINLPEGAHVSHGRLFVGETASSRILVWNDLQDALAGQGPDAILGDADPQDSRPEIGADKAFWPAAMHFDGDYLWGGEFKFSGRLVRWSPSP